ncbi:hypothetical protein SCHIN_v1c00870 [Spiroplasma chinense]|uniref:Uncharacterized protein n=1 Tax=Spiroplasma chinense TaxID=216932 RepID=A0A5B9Y3C2_9MOLU|nr:hypothetical protein [Spiroplasma chinense]QEH61285.1 hypothetical protein SCHIN_v1c00870 [Spiroplasma chinense]
MNSLRMNVLFSWLNFKFIFKSIINFVFLISISVLFFTFLGLYSSYDLKSDFEIKYYKLISIENTLTAILFGFFSIILVAKVYVTPEAKNRYLMEKQYGIKTIKSFGLRYLTIIMYLYLTIFAYFILQIFTIPFIVATNISIKMIVVPKLNLLIFSLLTSSLSLIFLTIFNSFYGIIAAITLISFMSLGSIFSALVKADWKNKNDIMLGEITYNIKLGQEFYKAAVKDGFNFYSEDYHLFKLNEQDENYYYKYFEGSENLSSFYKNKNIGNIKADFSNFYATFLKGQNLNRDILENNGEVKFILGFDLQYLTFFNELKEFLQSKDLMSNLKWQDTPSYNDILEIKPIKFDLTNFVLEIKKSEMMSRYKNLILFIEKNWNSLLNKNYNNIFKYKVFEEINVLPEGDNIEEKLWESSVLFQNKEVNDFYKKNPEFLLISQILNKGFVNSFNINFLNHVIYTDRVRNYVITLDEYDKYLKNNKTSQFINIFNLNGYLNSQYFNNFEKAIFLNQVQGLWDIKQTKYFDIRKQIKSNDYWSQEQDWVDTTRSIFSDFGKPKNSNILIYIYGFYLFVFTIASLLSFYIFLKKREVW